MIETRITVTRHSWSPSIEFRGGIHLPNGEFDIFLPMEKKRIGERVIEVDPFLTLSYDMAQKLMDQLYHCGFKPTEAFGSPGQVEALKNHLGDMREIVFKKLGMK